MQGEAKAQVPAKLKASKIEPIQWPKVPEYIEDVVISVTLSAAKEHGDNQYETSKHIKCGIETVAKGNWTVIICPSDEKT